MIRWYPLRFSPADYDALHAAAAVALPPGARIAEGRSRRRALSFLAGRAAVARLFREVGFSGVVVPDPELGFLVAVRPDGAVAPELFVNVSHTEGIAVAAVSRRPVGIDVERKTRNASRAILRVSSEEERAAAAALPAEFPGEVALWSAKEAVSKATGLGIKFGMRAFHVDLAGNPPFPVRLERTGPLPLTAPLVRLVIEEDWVVALCGERSELLPPPARVPR